MPKSFSALPLKNPHFLRSVEGIVFCEGDVGGSNDGAGCSVVANLKGLAFWPRPLRATPATFDRMVHRSPHRKVRRVMVRLSGLTDSLWRH